MEPLRNCVADRIGILFGVLCTTCALLLACADEAPRVNVRLIAAPGEEPYLGTSEIRIIVEDGDEDTANSTVGAHSTGGVLESVPFGSGLRVRAELFDGNRLHARGWSFPFDVPNSKSPAVSADVYMAPLGHVVAPVPDSLGSNVGAMARSPFGALVGTRDGLFELRLHGPSADGQARLKVLGEFAEDSSWASPDEGLLMRVSGNSADLYDATGLVASVTHGFASAHGTSFQAVGVPHRREVWVMGGLLGPERDTDVITVVSLDGQGSATTLRAAPADQPLPDAMSGFRALLVPIPGVTETGFRMLILDEVPSDSAKTNAYLIDTSDGLHSGPFVLDLDARGAALAILSQGRVFVVGGLHQPEPPPCPDAMDAPDEASNRIASLGVGETLVTLGPPLDDRLSDARAFAAATAFGNGLAYVGGGMARDATCAWSVVESGELVDDRGAVLEVFPVGRVPMQAPQAITMDNRLVLLAGQEGLAVYFPSRGP